MLTSILARLFGRASSRSEVHDARLIGTWRVVEIADDHPFRSYTLVLRGDGTHEWVACVPTKEGAEFEVRGSGAWRISGDIFEYSSGEASGALRYTLEGTDTLVLFGIPAVKVCCGVRCVLKRGEPS